jgi:DNA-directed RNA polymerase specialized sigma24 family protein
MSRNSKPHVRDFRDGYATCSDFCEVFRRNTTQLYLLAFLLTANHQEAQECFVGAMAKAFAERNVFKGWEESWSKRCLIEHAIGAIIFQPSRPEARRDVWFQDEGEIRFRTLSDGVTQLKSTERFVFVMTVLEGYSAKETALLLDRTPESVHNLRIEALQRLAELNPEMIVTVHPQESRLTPILLIRKPTSGFQDV